MTYEDNAQSKLRRQLARQAITLAMEGKWREAITANNEIIASSPDDAEAYNRLGRAYVELGLYSQAKQAYRQSTELDPHNTIARKNLERLAMLSEDTQAVGAPDKVEPEIFIEEMGKAGVVNLNDPAPPEVQAKVVAGDRVYLKPQGNVLAVETGHGEYLGKVDSKHGQRLIKLIGSGNQYAAAVTSAAGGKITVIIKETYQHPSQSGQISFPPRGIKAPKPYVSEKMFKGDADYEELNEETLEDYEEDTTGE
ncbi:MAG: tetratricopeptide repeat protein [Dehalococcoidia bacterium]|jgi:tetratricopeptide (TPR) repeat protein|nr:MAG: tetratricopeptide repeat protein [Dehalococcoidia bacterium]